MSKKKFDLNAYKKKVKTADVPMKKDTFVELDECMHEILGMKGLPMGHITQIYAKSDTGKTSLMLHAVAKAQEQGILPVVIVTEGKIDWDRARSMGVKYTGDLPENQKEDDFIIVEESLEFLEEVYPFMDKITADVSMGNLPENVMIFWDSLGNTLAEGEVEVDKKNGTVIHKATMMLAAKKNSTFLRSLSGKINNTRKVSFPKCVGLTIINTCYTKPPAFPGGMSSDVPYGGEALWYKCSLVIKLKRRKKLTAAKDGIKMGFGIVSTISVEKNHLTNTSHSGEYVITGNAIIPNEKTAIDAYKEAHKDEWGTAELIDDDTGELFDGSEE